MALHARNIAMVAGATGDEIDIIAKRMAHRFERFTCVELDFTGPPRRERIATTERSSGGRRGTHGVAA